MKPTLPDTLRHKPNPIPMKRYTLTSALLILALVIGSGCDEPAALQYDEVIVFIEAVDTDHEEARRRLAYLQEITNHFNTKTRSVLDNQKNFRLTIYPITGQSASASPLFSDIKSDINSQGAFDSQRFLQAYLPLLERTYNIDILGTIKKLENHLGGTSGSHFLVIYISDMVHVTREIDTSNEYMGKLNYDEFVEKKGYKNHVGDKGLLSRLGTIDIVVKTVREEYRDADENLPNFWLNDVFYQHLGASRVIRSEYALMEEIQTKLGS